MKRAITAALLLALLCGCGLADDSLPTADGLSPVPAETVQPSPAPTEKTGQVQTWEPAEESPEDMVEVKSLVPDIRVELKYSGADNFTGTALYDFDTAYLRRGTAEKLAEAQEKLSEYGLSLCIWDAWRPVAAQFALWRACPDARFVSNPFNGVTNHCRGNTVDVALVGSDGELIELPSSFDDFSVLADRDYSDVSGAAAENAGLLEQVMTESGFTGYFAEWWHYTDTDDYEIMESVTSLPTATADCKEYLSLIAAPDAASEALGHVPAGSELLVLDTVGDFSLVRYCADYGYVMSAYLKYQLT